MLLFLCSQMLRFVFLFTIQPPISSSRMIRLPSLTMVAAEMMRAPAAASLFATSNVCATMGSPVSMTNVRMPLTLT